MSVFALLERLTPYIESEVNLVINSNEDVESLSSKLARVQVGLQEAERIGVADKSVKNWLKELEYVTNEMNDVLDEWETAVLQNQVEDTSRNWDKVCTCFLYLCSCFKRVVSLREIAKKMKSLSLRVDTILTDKYRYMFVSSENDGTRVFKQEESTSLVNGSNIYGLDQAKESLIRKLVAEGDDTQTIPIVGAGGIGKTTLAQLTYNDPQIYDLFYPKAWVSVSQNFNAPAIAREILESFGEKSDDAHTLDTLVRRIKKVVDNKRFLLVLDNVWAEDRNKWEEIRNCLNGGRGGRIVITTRDESVARMMGTSQWQQVGLLSDSDCGAILNGVALEGRTSEECENLRDIGMEIAKKCNGLPVAAKSVGSMLAYGSFTVREWRDVLESPIWTNRGEESEVFRILNFSYTDLSPLLKRCFLSCVIFPKGTLINIDEITKIWMAYGYLNSNASIDEVKLKGFQILNKLATRSFLQKFASVGKDTMLYRMHDIMHDFAAYLSGREEHSFIVDAGLEKGKSSDSLKNLPWDSLGRLHNFSVSKEELRPDIISHLTSVRVLSLRECNLQGVPEDIGKLIHLRYLNVSGNPITELPDTVTDLYNLQTLDIGSCINLLCLPEGIGKLINLRHLLNSKTYRLVEYPQGLEKLTGLWTLCEFRGSNLGCLRNLNQLQGSLSLFLKDSNEIEAGNAELWKKNYIENLWLKFDEEEKQDEVVYALMPPPNLQTLAVYAYSGKWLSHWIHTSFDNLKVVSFSGRGKCSIVPPFGKLPALEDLTIDLCRFKRLGIEFLGLGDANNMSSSSSGQVVGGFPRLKKLRFTLCHEWEEWADIDEEHVPVMGCLEELEISGCRKLKVLPHNLLDQATSLRVARVPGSKGLYNKFT